MSPTRAKRETTGPEIHIQLGVVLPIAGENIGEILLRRVIVGVADTAWQLQNLAAHEVGRQRHPAEVLLHPGNTFHGVNICGPDDASAALRTTVVLTIVLQLKTRQQLLPGLFSCRVRGLLDRHHTQHHSGQAEQNAEHDQRLHSLAHNKAPGAGQSPHRPFSPVRSCCQDQRSRQPPLAEPVDHLSISLSASSSPEVRGSSRTAVKPRCPAPCRARSGPPKPLIRQSSIIGITRDLDRSLASTPNADLGPLDDAMLTVALEALRCHLTVGAPGDAYRPGCRASGGPGAQTRVVSTLSTLRSPPPA